MKRLWFLLFSWLHIFSYILSKSASWVLRENNYFITFAKIGNYVKLKQLKYGKKESPQQ